MWERVRREEEIGLDNGERKLETSGETSDSFCRGASLRLSSISRDSSGLVKVVFQLRVRVEPEAS